MTQEQNSQIVSFLTQNCQLTETAFVEEMTDHFVTSMEAQITDSFSFHQAFKQVIEDFGGKANIQKMERAYRIVFFRNQFRIWWGLVKGQFHKPKLIRLLAVVSLVVAACLYFTMSSFIGLGEQQVFWFAFQGSSVVPMVTLSLFALQRFFPASRRIVIVRSSRLFRTMLSYFLVVSALMVVFIFSTVQISLLVRAVCVSVLLSTLSVMYLAFLDYSMKTVPDQLHPREVAGH